MQAPFSGGCACGAIRYTATSKPLYMGNCHCRDCQQATGSAYFPAVVVKKEDFTLESGAPSWFERDADAGHAMLRGFCPACGSPLFLQNGRNDTVMVLYAGSLDDPSGYQPVRDIYVASAQPWDVMDPDVAKVDGMPEW